MSDLAPVMDGATEAEAGGAAALNTRSESKVDAAQFNEATDNHQSSSSSSGSGSGGHAHNHHHSSSSISLPPAVSEHTPVQKKKRSRGRRLKQDNSDLDLLCRWRGCEPRGQKLVFADPGDARNHEFSIHIGMQRATQTNPELCCKINKCEAIFTQMSSLSKHMFSVHGLRKFRCPYCEDARFVDKNHLNRHLQKHFPRRTPEEINQLIADHEEDMMVRLENGKILVVDPRRREDGAGIGKSRLGPAEVEVDNGDDDDDDAPPPTPAPKTREKRKAATKTATKTRGGSTKRGKSGGLDPLLMLASIAGDMEKGKKV